MTMPIILKWLIAAALFVCLMIIGTFFPHSIVRVLAGVTVPKAEKHTVDGPVFSRAYAR